MTRGIGLEEWFASLPEVVVLLAAILTQLGDLWFLTLVLGLLYWLGPHTPGFGDAIDRERIAIVVGLLVLGIALTETLKLFFALPRPPWFDPNPVLSWLSGPPAPAYAWLAGASGHGFPSGHAIATTVSWGGLAWAIRAGARRRRVAIAAAVVVTVAFARVVLGVHYIVDVVVGVAVALLVLAVVLRGRRWPVLPFALATLVALLGVAMNGLTTDVAGTLGLAAGTAGSWAAVGRAAVDVAGELAAKATAALGVAFVLPPLAAAVVAPVAPVVTLALSTVGGAALIALPLVGARVERMVAG